MAKARLLWMMAFLVLLSLSWRKNSWASGDTVSGKEQKIRQKRAEALPRVTTNPQLELTDIPDVLFLVQQPGLTSQDLSIVKAFMKECGRAVHSVGSHKYKSRFAVTMFSALSKHMVTFDDCCGSGLGHLDYMLNNRVYFFDPEALRLYDRKNHADLSPESIDLEYGLYALRERQVLDKLLPQYKPTVLFLLLNFKAPKMSFNILNAAVKEIKKLKAFGIHIVTVIVDPLANRQPQINRELTKDQQSLLQKNKDPFDLNQAQSLAKTLANYLKNRRPNFDESEKRLHALLEKYRGKNDKLIGGIAKLYEPRIQPKLNYKNLVLEYAKALSSIPAYGFKLNSYDDFWRRDVFAKFTEIVANPMTWFGIGEVKVSCLDTRNVIQKLLWSPGYLTGAKYPNGLECKWTITVSEGHYVSLTFVNFKTEETFDSVTMYDGDDEKNSPVLAIYSGNMPAALTFNSTREIMLVHFKTDGGNNERGFQAKWDAAIISDPIRNASLVFLVDVSGSLTREDLVPVSEWVHTAIRFFDLERKQRGERSGDENKENNQVGGISSRKEDIPMWRRFRRQTTNQDRFHSSYVGLLSFAEDSEIVKDIVLDQPPAKLRDMVRSLKITREPTYLGRAMDFARINQFKYLRETKGLNPAYLRQVLFVFSDWHSVDLPRPAIDRLCQANIIPVFVGIGIVNLQSREDLISKCGFAFYVEASVGDPLLELRKVWGLFKPMTTPEPTTTASTTLPPKPTTTTLLESSTTSPQTTTRTYPYTGTYPTLPPAMTPVSTDDDFNYDGVAGLLVAIGILQTIGLCTQFFYTCSLEIPLLASESSESMVRVRKRNEEEQIKKLPEVERIRLAYLPKTEEEPEPERRKSRYPEAANSFFTRRAVLPEHLEARNQTDF